jgi:hypothetical protein
MHHDSPVHCHRVCQLEDGTATSRPPSNSAAFSHTQDRGRIRADYEDAEIDTDEAIEIVGLSTIPIYSFDIFPSCKEHNPVL